MSYESIQEIKCDCPVCGRQFIVLYPALWSFRRPIGCHMKKLCSWGCCVKVDNRKKSRRLLPVELPSEAEEEKQAKEDRVKKDWMEIKPRLWEILEEYHLSMTAASELIGKQSYYLGRLRKQAAPRMDEASAVNLAFRLGVPVKELVYDAPSDDGSRKE